MPGRSRIDAAGALRHVMVRGIERIELFRGDTDRGHFAERSEVEGRRSGCPGLCPGDPLAEVPEDTKAKGYLLLKT